MINNYKMSLDDRYQIFGDKMMEYTGFEKFVFVAAIIMIIVGICIIFSMIKNGFVKDHDPLEMSDIIAGIFMFMFGLFFIGISCVVMYMMYSDKQYIKEVVDTNSKHMRYITFDVKGDVNNIYDDGGTQRVRFDDNKRNYYFNIDNNVPIALGDKVKVKSTEKIPTSDDYDVNDLTDNSAKDTKITIIVTHKGEEKEIHFDVKGVSKMDIEPNDEYKGVI